MSHDATIERLTALLHQQQCSLVVCDANGIVTCHHQKGVRDLINLLDHAPERLVGAIVADKVVGKAAAALMVNGRVRQIHADVMSRLALPLLDQAGIDYSWGQLVNRIVIPDGDDRCRLEAIVAEAHDAHGVESLLRRHFEEMNLKRKINPNSKQQ